MLKVLQRDQWQDEIKKVRQLKLNEEVAFVNTIGNCSSLKPTFFLYEKNNNPVISLIAFTSGKKIRHPFHFFYSAFWVHGGLSDTQYCEYLDEFIAELLIRYDNVEIKLPTDLIDIRPFLWNNFSITNYYTYVKDLENLDYHPSTSKNIRKAKQGNYICCEEELDELSLSLNLKLFEDLKVYGSKSIGNIGKLMKSLSESACLKSFNCYLDNKLIASNLILLDEKFKVAYTVLLNKTSRAVKDDVHSLLHDFFFSKLKDDGYSHVDLLGGDMKSIAAFKSRFKANLQLHFLVSYSKRKAKFGTGIHKLTNFAKSMLKKFN